MLCISLGCISMYVNYGTIKIEILRVYPYTCKSLDEKKTQNFFLFSKDTCIGGNSGIFLNILFDQGVFEDKYLIQVS